MIIMNKNEKTNQQLEIHLLIIIVLNDFNLRARKGKSKLDILAKF